MRWNAKWKHLILIRLFFYVRSLCLQCNRKSIYQCFIRNHIHKMRALSKWIYDRHDSDWMRHTFSSAPLCICIDIRGIERAMALVKSRLFQLSMAFASSQRTIHLTVYLCSKKNLNFCDILFLIPGMHPAPLVHRKAVSELCYWHSSLYFLVTCSRKK